jgi:hypothetical protein
MVAKKETTATKMGRPPLGADAKAHVMNLRGRAEWKSWLVEFAEEQRCDQVDLIDYALEHYAKSKGFRRPPKR